MSGLTAARSPIAPSETPSASWAWAVIGPEMRQQLTRRGMLLARAHTQPPGGRRTGLASMKLGGEQASNLVHASRLEECRLRLPHIRLGRGNEGLELNLLIDGSFNQQPRIVAKIGKLLGRRPQRHSSRSCAVAIRCRKLGG